MKRIGLTASEEMSFENVDRRTSDFGSGELTREKRQQIAGFLIMIRLSSTYDDQRTNDPVNAHINKFDLAVKCM